MNADLLHGFYLRNLLVEPLTGKVTGPSGSGHLAPRAAEVLVQLASVPGELVTRETLLEEVWGEGQGSAELLSRVIGEIRQVLDDHADAPVFIQTLPRRGYRLIVTPEPVGESTSSIVLGVRDGARAGDFSFLENLQQRGVFETALAYIVFGWVLLQATDIVFNQLHMPPWIGTFVTVLVFAGFPIALVLSWFLEIRHGNAVLDSLSAAARRRRRFSRTYLSIIGALALAGVLVFVYDRYFGLPKPEVEIARVPELAVSLPPVAESSIAVLPFLNIDGGEDTGIFATGLVDDVITRLARVPGLKVSSRGDSFTLAANSPSQLVRNRLRVARYLEGSVQVEGSQIRVIVQLIDSETGFHILSRSFDRSREDFFDIRDEITELTVAYVRPALPPDTRSATLQAVDDPVLDAYVLYRKGVEASRAPMSIDTVTTALHWFNKALAIDPEYAAAHAGKCATYIRGYTEVDDATFIEKAESACANALELNANLDIVHTALGSLYVATGKYGDAFEQYQAALKIDPSNVDALFGLGDVYAAQNEPGLAEASLRQAIGLHPGDANAYNRLGYFLYRAGRYGEAAEQYQNVVALNPEDMNGHSNLGTSFMLMGEFESARTAFEKAIAITPKKNSYSNLGLMHYYLGDFDAAIGSLEQAVELEPNDYLARSNLGDALWASGRVEESRASFETARTLAGSAFQINPADSFTMMDLAWIYAMLDDFENAQNFIERSLELAPDDAYGHFYAALIAMRVGDVDAAMGALERAAEAGYSIPMMASEPHFKSLRNNPKFIAIISDRHR